MATALDLPVPGCVDGIRVHPEWRGSFVTGWLFTCPLRCGLGGVHRPGRSETFDSEGEAVDRAGDHWTRHEQER